MQCQEGYQPESPLCALCSEGYYLQLRKCSFCKEPKFVSLVGLGVGLMVVVGILVCVWRKYSDYLSDNILMTHTKILVSSITILRSVEISLSLNTYLISMSQHR